jgi:hypothetical protein
MKFFFLYIILISATAVCAQRKKPFSGELLFSAEKVYPKDSVQENILIYAKDSLTKIITFSSQLGKQELIKHLGVQRSYLLLETSKGKFAVKTDIAQSSDTTQLYTFKKARGSKKILGKKAKKLTVTFTDIDKKFTFYYFKKVSAAYGSAYTDFPGLVVEYFLPTDRGMYRYVLTDLKIKDPPLQIFTIPEGFKRVSLDAFMEEMTRP